MRLCPAPASRATEGEQLLEEWLGDTIGDVPKGLSAGRRDEGGDVEPFEAVVAERHRAHPARRPAAPPMASDRAGVRRWRRLRSACRGGARLLPRPGGEVFFKRLAFFLARRPGVVRPGHLQTPLDCLQRLPAPLRRHRLQAQFARHPSRHLRPRPQAAVRRRLFQALFQHRQDFRRTPSSSGSSPQPFERPIAQRRRALVVARKQLLEPALAETRTLREPMAFGQKQIT